MNARVVSHLAIQLLVASTVITASIGVASADGPLGPSGSKLATSNYRVDLFQGPVLASSRVSGLAGSYSAIGEGIDGHSVLAAAPAVREAFSTSYIDYDVSFSITFPGGLKNTDFDNDGKRGFAYQNFVFATLGTQIQVGTWGFGISIDTQTYTVLDGFVRPIDIGLSRAVFLLAKTFANGQLAVGVGLRTAALSLETTDTAGANERLFRTVSQSLQLGAIWMPHRWPIRASLTTRLPTRPDVGQQETNKAVTTPQGDLTVGSRFLPMEVAIPWEIEAGFAVQLGKRPLNPEWINPHDLPSSWQKLHPDIQKQRLKERYQALHRERLLLTASLLISGSVRDAIGVESFLTQTIAQSGERLSFTPRFGVEGEPILNWMTVRAGSYLEPSRFRDGVPRLHGTLGIDVRTIRFSLFGLVDPATTWKLGVFGDVAHAYVAWSFTLGIWH